MGRTRKVAPLSQTCVSESLLSGVPWPSSSSHFNLRSGLCGLSQPNTDVVRVVPEPAGGMLVIPPPSTRGAVSPSLPVSPGLSVFAQPQQANVRWMWHEGHPLCSSQPREVTSPSPGSCLEGGVEKNTWLCRWLESHNLPKGEKKNTAWSDAQQRDRDPQKATSESLV